MNVMFCYFCSITIRTLAWHLVRTYTALGVPKYQYFKYLDLYDTAGYKASRPGSKLCNGIKQGMPKATHSKLIYNHQQQEGIKRWSFSHIKTKCTNGTCSILKQNILSKPEINSFACCEMKI